MKIKLKYNKIFNNFGAKIFIILFTHIKIGIGLWYWTMNTRIDHFVVDCSSFLYFLEDRSKDIRPFVKNNVKH